MESKKEIILGFDAFPNKPFETDAQREEFFSSKTYITVRLLHTLIQYLQQHTKYFDRISVDITYQQDRIWPNGTLEGLIKKIIHSEIDVAINPSHMIEVIAPVVDFSYPYKLDAYTFATRKPEYKPHIFGIFHMFSLSVWLTILSILIAMPLVSYAILKRKYTFSKISFEVFAILMKQNSFIKPSTLVEKLLVYSWVVGAMILCLSYDSVFLSFLSIPPLTKIKHLSDLALAVESGDYHCTSFPNLSGYWKYSKNEHLKIIATDSVNNNLSHWDPLTKFLRDSPKQNLALMYMTNIVDILDPKIFYFSEDRFDEVMRGMMVRKGFCCKELLDSFVHKMMASGIYNKYFNDISFLISNDFNSLFGDSETTNRKITLTDVAPAFIFLLTGYFISFLVLIVEIVLGRKKRNFIKVIKKKKRGRVYDENPV